MRLPFVSRDTQNHHKPCALAKTLRGEKGSKQVSHPWRGCRWTGSRSFCSLRIIGPSKMIKNGYFEDATPAIQVQTFPLEGPRSLGLFVCETPLKIHILNLKKNHPMQKGTSSEPKLQFWGSMGIPWGCFRGCIFLCKGILQYGWTVEYPWGGEKTFKMIGANGRKVTLICQVDSDWLLRIISLPGKCYLACGFNYCFIFTPTWGHDRIWLLFFRSVEATN